jgi:putative flippase GtrA
MLKLLVRYVKFVGTGLVGTVVDTIVLWILSDFAFTRGYWGEYVISPALSFQSAVLVNFTISYFYVWKDRMAPGRGVSSYFKHYLAYNLSCTSVFLIRLGGILLIERFTGWDVVICNLVAMCVSGLVNFVLSDNLVFRNRN